ncbi:hypothetical protein Enr13x_73170 [Stieleria neptunia]|uniref:Uncharacterized protein n=1 Tax=Stieleria neptunia TaxID=2527979 RepID=A0A518I2U7_9BACT|nr:hypothetical protein [Stieleria neptunia]QDV47408.1 hypothetical protein Enr13x_73170 [Stieleria neptunia]
MTETAKYPVSWLTWFLWLVGVVSQLAFVAAVMPESWIVEITDQLRLEPFPDTPLAFYLARHLSLLYGFIGIALIVVSYRITAFRAFIGALAIGIIAFGLLQGLIDFQSGMPVWWTAGESVSTIIGGGLMFWLHRRCG